MTQTAPARPTWLFVLPWSLDAVGGVNQVVLSLCAEMQARGDYQPLVLVADWHAAQAAQSLDAPVPTVSWRIRSKGGGLKERVAYRLWLYSFRRRFAAFCREHQVAVINPHYVGDTSLSLQQVVAGFSHRPSMLFSFHGADLSSIASDQAATLYWTAALQRPGTAAVTCSAALGQRLSAALKGVPAKVVHNGVDMDLILERTPPRPNKQRRQILTVGKFEEKKGQSTLLQAFALLSGRFTDVDLVVIGAEDRELPALQALAEQLGIAARVRFEVDVPHARIGNHFSEADIFALPSRQEPFGLVILEAAAFQLPVIASRVGGIPEIIRDGDTGLLVDPDAPQQLADRIEALLLDPEAAAAMGARLHHDVRQRFSWEKAARAYAAIVESLR